MSVGEFGGERCTFGNVKDGDFELVDLPAIATCKEIDMTNYVEITVRTFATPFLVTISNSQSAAATKMTTKKDGSTAVMKFLAGESYSQPVAGNAGKLYIAAASGGPITDDLQIIKVRGS